MGTSLEDLLKLGAAIVGVLVALRQLSVYFRQSRNSLKEDLDILAKIPPTAPYREQVEKHIEAKVRIIYAENSSSSIRIFRAASASWIRVYELLERLLPVAYFLTGVVAMFWMGQVSLLMGAGVFAFMSWAAYDEETKRRDRVAERRRAAARRNVPDTPPNEA